MKLILCTLAICVSLFAAVLTLEELIRTEAKRTRAALPRALIETAAEQESVSQKLDALNAQMTGLSRRLGELEAAVAKRPAAAEAAPPNLPLESTVHRVAAAQERLALIPTQITDLSSFLDRSFEHVDDRIGALGATQGELKTSLTSLATKAADHDRYFKLLYTFLGLAFDKDNEDALKAYPSFDARINEALLNLENLRLAVEDVRKRLTPVVIEPTTRPPR